jgi:hypothetical protein
MFRVSGMQRDMLGAPGKRHGWRAAEAAHEG